MAMALTEKQFPFTTEYGLATGPLKSKGPTAEACKRFFARMGRIQWTDFDQHYNKMLWEEMADFKIDNGLRKKSQPRDGSYSEKCCEIMRTKKVPAGRPNAGEWGVDMYSRKIVQDEAGKITTGGDVSKVQFYIAQFWNILIEHSSSWHYSQHRPIDTTVNPAAGGYNDCSGAVIQAHRYAQEESGIIVPDPSKWDYKGYGNTDYHLEDWPKIGAPFRIGDLGHFHSSRHVIECIKPGNFDTAVWGSNGSEAAPDRISPLRSYYRFPEEYMFTVRPPLTKEELDNA
jgi:hypothetical protein